MSDEQRAKYQAFIDGDAREMKLTNGRIVKLADGDPHAYAYAVSVPDVGCTVEMVETAVRHAGLLGLGTPEDSPCTKS